MNKSYLRLLKSTLFSEVFFLQNVIKAKYELLNKKAIPTINGNTNSRKNIYILREKKRESEKYLKVTAFYFLL